MDARVSALTFFAFISIWASPRSIQRVDFRTFSNVKAVALNKSSPAYAALQDSQSEYTEIKENNDLEDVPAVENLIVGLSLRQRKDTEAQPLKLEMRISPVEIQQSTSTSVTKAPAEETQKTTGTPKQRRDYLAELIEDQKSWHSESYVQAAERLVQREIASQGNRTEGLSANAKTILTSNGNEITVKLASNNDSNSISTNPNYYSSALDFLGINKNTGGSGNSTKSSGLSRSEKPLAPDKKSTSKRDSPDSVIASNSGDSRKEDESAFSTMAMATEVAPGQESEYKKSRLVSGTITFAEGAALLSGRDQITMDHLINGMIVSRGKVNLTEAKFNITVDQLDGIIEAKVRTHQGAVTALGSINLLDLDNIKNQNNQIRNLAMVLSPVVNGLQAEIVSAASYEKTTYAITDARLFVADISREIVRDQLKKTYLDQSIVMPSTYILVAKKPRFWPSLSISESGVPSQVRLFPDGLINAFLELSTDPVGAREAQNKGIIWGRVSYQGKPLEGAQIKIIGDDEENTTYFSGFLPDKKRVHTSNNGEFAISSLSGTEKLLRVSIRGKSYWPTIVPVEGHSVTYADLTIEPTRTVLMESFDAFTDEDLEAAVQPFGTSEEMYIDKSGRLKVSVDSISGRNLLEADAGKDYAMTRVELSSNKTELPIPHFKQSWLNSIRKEYKPQEGLVQTQVLGLVLGDDFDVILGSENEFPVKLSYFDSKGKEVFGHGVAGGGFIIFDLTPGLHTITIVPGHSKNIVTQLIYVDDRALSVSKIDLGAF